MVHIVYYSKYHRIVEGIADEIEYGEDKKKPEQSGTTRLQNE